MMTTDFITRHWPLTDPVVKLLKQSGGRMVYKVDALESVFVLKIAGPVKSEAAVRKDTQILRFLEEARYPAPRLLLSREGKEYVVLDGNCVYVLTYLDGVQPAGNEQSYAALGRMTARLHSLRGYTTPTNFRPTSEIPIMLARARVFGMDPRYAELIGALPDFARFPTCLIHTDIGPHNSVQLPNGDIELIDWDDAGVGTRILDLGAPLIGDFLTKDLVFQTGKARAFYAAYGSIVALTDQEKEHLFDAGLFFALSYTIFDDSGIAEGQWRKVLWAIEHRAEIELSLVV